MSGRASASGRCAWQEWRAAAGVRFMGEGVVQTVWWEPEPAAGGAEVTSHFKGGRAVNFFDPDGIILELQEPVERGKVT